MKPKEYLSRYIRLKSEKSNLLDERSNILIDEAQPQGLDYSSDHVQSSSGDKMFNTHLRIEKRTKEIDERLEIIDLQMNQIIGVINEIEDGTSKRLLYLKYIEGKSWYDIAADLRYDSTYVRGQLHQKALKLVETSYKFLQNLTFSYTEKC